MTSPWPLVAAFIVAYFLLRLIDHRFRLVVARSKGRKPEEVAADYSHRMQALDDCRAAIRSQLHSFAPTVYKSALESEIKRNKSAISDEARNRLLASLDEYESAGLDHAVDSAMWPHDVRPLPLDAIEVPVSLDAVHAHAADAVLLELRGQASVTSQLKGIVRQGAERSTTGTTWRAGLVRAAGAALAKTYSDPVWPEPLKAAIDEYQSQYVELRNLHYELARLVPSNAKRDVLLRAWGSG